MERKVVYLQMPAVWKMGGSHLGAHILEDRGLMSQILSTLSVETGVFIRRERGTEQRAQERGLQSSLCADEHSPFW